MKNTIEKIRFILFKFFYFATKTSKQQEKIMRLFLSKDEIQKLSNFWIKSCIGVKLPIELLKYDKIIRLNYYRINETLEGINKILSSTNTKYTVRTNTKNKNKIIYNTKTLDIVFTFKGNSLTNFTKEFFIIDK